MWPDWVTNCLQKAGINIDTIPGLNYLFEQDNPIANPFRGIDKEPLQYKYYKDEFSLVVSNIWYIERYSYLSGTEPNVSLFYNQTMFLKCVYSYLDGRHQGGRGGGGRSVQSFCSLVVSPPVISLLAQRMQSQCYLKSNHRKILCMAHCLFWQYHSKNRKL